MAVLRIAMNRRFDKPSDSSHKLTENRWCADSVRHAIYRTGYSTLGLCRSSRSSTFVICADSVYAFRPGL
jgi:hypothetical protein